MDYTQVVSYTNTEDKRDDKQFNWQLSYFSKSYRDDIILQPISCSLHSCRGPFGIVCPLDLKTLEFQTRSLHKEQCLEPVSEDTEIEEARPESYDSESDPHRSRSAINSKRRTWDEYKRLAKLAESMPKPDLHLKPVLTHVTSLRKICISRREKEKEPFQLSTQAKRSIVKTAIQKTILIANSTYVKFHNFKLKKLYKKVISLKNIDNSPARFQFDSRPSQSKFLVVMKTMKGNRKIIPPGIKLRLIIYFRCDELTEPEEMLKINVQNGKPVFIKLHGYRDIPVLKGIRMMCEEFCNPWGENVPSSINSWHQEINFDGSVESMIESYSESSFESATNSKLNGLIFDCKRGFVGERIHVTIRFKNIGGTGRFFVMSEIDWCSMHIEDVTRKNALIMFPFVLQPVYFALKSQEEISLHTYFFPDSYGTHVDKLYILCDNCSMVATEIIGDGVMYEQCFIRISKEMEKHWPSMNFDKSARYYINLGVNISSNILRGVISVTNTSEIDMHFRWTKRNGLVDENKFNEIDNFPLECLDIHPNHGILSSSSTHHFTVTADLNNLHPYRYFTVLQLYVEDIPTTSISKIMELHTKLSTNRRRICLSSVDIWIADVEVWIQCVSPGDEYIEGEYESIAEAHSGIHCWLNEHPEESDLVDDEESVDEFKSTSELMTEELFSHHDLVNLQQVLPLLLQRVTCIGTIRLTRVLYVGMEESYTFVVKNRIHRSLTYTWGESEGTDESKVKLCIHPKSGDILAGSEEEIRITFLPLKEGIVRSLNIPCYIGDYQRIISLGVECTIEPLHVSFYFPSEGNEALKFNTFNRIQWRADSLQTAFDLAGRLGGNIKVLDKYRHEEERELMNMDLDQGDALRDTSVGSSTFESNGEKHEKEYSSSAGSSDVIQTNDTMKNEVVPFYKAILPTATQPVVLEFLNLSLRTVKRQTFFIKNETAIPSSFWLGVKNFYPVDCSCQRKLNEKSIKLIYRKVFGRDKHLAEETLSRTKQSGSGVVIYVHPLRSSIGPFEDIPIDVYVFADTWGIYIDELEINIVGLPVYTLGICIQVIGSPILLPIQKGSPSNIPVIRYGVKSLGTRLQSRKIYMRNTSVIPVAVTWHTFLIEPTLNIKTMPFNVVFDIVATFTDELASKLRNKTETNETEKLLKGRTKRYKPGRGAETFDKFDPISISDGSDGFSDQIPTDSSYWSCYTFETWSNDESSSNFRKRSSIDRDKLKQDKCKKMRDTEFNISIIPYYGEADTQACTISPREVFIPSKGNAQVTLFVHPRKCNNIETEVDFRCKALGFLRVAPTDKYRDNCYAREDGYFFPPIEIDIEANIVKPRLTFDISEFERTFKVCVNDVMQSPKKEFRTKKTFFFYNTESDGMFVHFETHEPFAVECVSIYAETKPSESPGNVSINGHGCAEVEVSCTVDNELIETILHANKCQDFHKSHVTLKERLLITHTDKSTQELQLILKIQLPLLSLSSYTLNFGLVYVGDTKKLILVVKNLSVCEQNFIIKKKLNDTDFSVGETKGRLLSRNIAGSSHVVTISFTPKVPKQSIETLEIMTNAPNSTEECVLYGEGTLDEIYHISGF